MVAVLHTAPEASAPQALAAWLDQVGARLSTEDRASIAAALEFARELYGDTRTAEGERLLDRSLGTVSIMAGLDVDVDSMRAAVLLGAPQCPAFDPVAMARAFGNDVAAMVVGVDRMGAIRTVQREDGKEAREAQAESLRKMLLAMVEDIRVVLIKLAERTQALRYLMTADEPAQQRAAREVLELFAPLANRLGIWQLKWELEDLSLRALEPGTYKGIAKLLDERRLDRQHYIERVKAHLKRELAAAGIQAEVTGRPKHIYSIWSKMQRKQAGIESLYDIRAVRILVEDVKDCYAALGIVHNLWTPLPGEFDDYIAKPKANDYRSLHTAVFGPEGKSLEVQIRTFDMHRASEYGVAAHWRYKEGTASARRDPGFDDKIAWLRQVLDWKDAVADAGTWLHQFKSSLFADTIFVMTPQGKVVDLPRGATPVDFAYAVHSNIGHRCRGARVNGVLVPLNYSLKSGEQVEVITAKQGGPSRDWLNPELGFVRSNRARAKVRQWFKAEQLEETLAHGRELVERELQRAGMTALKLEALASEAGFAKIEDLFAAVARAEINHRQLQLAIRSASGAGEAAAQPGVEPPLIARQSKALGTGSGILIVGVDQLLTGLARCCKPAPPEAIVGFVTRGKGISIHRQTCANVARMRDKQPERLITAEWGAPDKSGAEVFPVDVVVEAMDRQGLLRDISEVFSREKINVTAVNTLSRNLHARMSFTLEVRGLPELKRALGLVHEVRGVLGATRR